MISVSALTKLYQRSRHDGAKALDGVTFSVPDKSIFGFLGPNGAGKTTTIRILATILPPTQGTASVQGYDIRREALKVKASIGYMPEYPGYYPTMTAEQHLDYWGQFYRMPRAERRRRAKGVNACSRSVSKVSWSHKDAHPRPACPPRISVYRPITAPRGSLSSRPRAARCPPRP